VRRRSNDRGFVGPYLQAVYFAALWWLPFVAAYQFAQLPMAFERPA